MPFSVDTDAGECGRLDGRGQYGLIIRPGARGNPSGAMYVKTGSVAHSISTPGDEAYALAQGANKIHVYRWVTEWLAGLHPSPYDSEFSPDTAPISFGMRQDTAAEFTTADPGATGCPAHTITHNWFRHGMHPTRRPSDPTPLQPPTHIGVDNQVIVEIAWKQHQSDQLKNLRPMLRWLAGIFEGIRL